LQLGQVRLVAFVVRFVVPFVARAVFAAEGLAVPLDEIARRAGVGIGTIYRHFPTKETLFAAIVHDRLALLADEAAELAAAPLAATAFHDFLARMMVELKDKRDLSEALVGAGIDVKAATAAPSAALRKSLDALLRRARAAGAVRSGIRVEDILALVSAAIHASAKTGGSPERVLAVISDGLRPPRR